MLAVSQGGEEDGAAIVLEIESGKPWQHWTLKKNENGSYCLAPKHASKKGLDLFRGNATPGAQIDLWKNKVGDPHLQWIIKPLAGTLSAVAGGACRRHQRAAMIPPKIKERARCQKASCRNSRSRAAQFQGPCEMLTVFLCPPQYKGGKPACVYVQTDGFHSEEQKLLETLIASKEMPVAIGVFVEPGNLPATVEKTLGRRNRCFEYDGLGDNNVRFLVDELLPFVAKQFDLKLSTSGNDRCIVGKSSGADHDLSMRRGNGRTPLAAFMPTAAASSRFVEVMSCPR